MSVEVTWQNGVCRARLVRPDASNAIDAATVAALEAVVRDCRERAAAILVLEGLPDVFCTGGDLDATAAGARIDPGVLYDLWRELGEGPFVSVAVVRGRVLAGGIGLAAACDIVLCDPTASFGLSEMLFGLFPACVMPFLVRRVGPQKAHYLTLTTRTLGAAEALDCGLADAVGEDAEALLRVHLRRLSRLSVPAIIRYKTFRTGLDEPVARHRDAALEANRAMFDDPAVRQNITRYATEMKFPWE